MVCRGRSVEELLSYVGRQPCLRSRSPADPGLVALEVAASCAATSRVPPPHGAVGRTGAAASTVRIGLVADLVKLLECPRRPGDQAEGEPATNHRRRHIAYGSLLAH